MPNQIFPCPYCGSTHIEYYAEIETIECDEGYFYCLSCNMRGPSVRTISGATYAWNSLSRKLQWTKKTPTEEGRYFYKRESGVGIALVYAETWGLTVFGGRTDPYNLETFADYWAGPIPEPVHVEE